MPDLACDGRGIIRARRFCPLFCRIPGLRRRDRHLFDAVFVASAFELGCEIGVEHRHGFVVGDKTRREDDDVGIVVAADERRDFGLPGQAGADADAC